MSGIDPVAPAPGGLFDSLRALTATLAAMAQTRVALFGTELEEEIDRIAVMLLGAMIALALASLAALFVALLVVALYWDTHRVGSIAAVAGTFVALAGAAGLVVFFNARRRTRLLAATAGEFEQDRKQLTPQAP